MCHVFSPETRGQKVSCCDLDLSLSSLLEDSVLAELNSLRNYSLVGLSQNPDSLIGTLSLSLGSASIVTFLVISAGQQLALGSEESFVLVNWHYEVGIPQVYFCHPIS